MDLDESKAFRELVELAIKRQPLTTYPLSEFINNVENVTNRHVVITTVNNRLAAGADNVVVLIVDPITWKVVDVNWG